MAINYLANLDWEHYYNWPNTINKMEGAGACGCMVVGANNQGKTFGLRCICVNRFINRDPGRGRQFVEVCRIKDDISPVARDYCEKIMLLNIFPGWQFTSKGNAIRARQCPVGCENDFEGNKEPWEVMGYVISLKDFMRAKRATFPDVGYIIFDEVIIEYDNVSKHYLDNEWTKLERLCVAVWRERPGKKSEGRVFLLGNSVDISCPYFETLGIGIPEYGQRWCAGKNWLFDYVKPNDYKLNAVRQTVAYRLFHGADKSAMLNEFVQDNDKFIKDRPDDCKHRYTIVYRDSKFGVWTTDKGTHYITRKLPVDWETRDVYALTNADNNPDYTLVRKSAPAIKLLIHCYTHGNMYFSDAQTRERFAKVLKLFGLH